MFDPAPPPLTHDPVRGGRPSSRPCKGSVLVVDDELMVARIYARALGAEGFRVFTATDGETAEAMFRETTFDAVVSDVCMPGMDGLRLLSSMRRIDAKVPVIVATGDHADERAQRAVEEGALMYLVKPIDLRALTQVVAHATQLHRLSMQGSGVRARLSDAAVTARFESALQKLWIAYQPIVDCSTHRVVGYEALARSDEPRLADPGVLFDAAQHLGRTLELGRAIRARIAADVPRAPHNVRIFVNLHVAELRDDGLFAASEPLRPYAGRVVIEVTERESLHSVADIGERLRHLRDAGFHLAVDDLGSGYSGLASLIELSPSVVKLDVCMVRGIDQDPMKRKIVQAMVGLCREMSVELIAEGVETDREQRTLGGLGCRLHQGFAYARPDREFVTLAA